MPKVSETYLEERRQHILDAAMACFARKGFRATTMEEIGNEAGLSPGVAYRYFSSKDEIIEASITSGLERWGRYMQEMKAGDFLEGLDAFTRAWVDRLEQPGIDTYYKVRMKVDAELTQDGDSSEQFRRMFDEGMDHFEQVMRSAQDRGQLDSSVDPRTMGRILVALINGLALQWVVEPDMDVWSYREAVMAMFRDSFRPREQDQSD